MDQPVRSGPPPQVCIRAFGDDFGVHSQTFLICSFCQYERDIKFPEFLTPEVLLARDDFTTQEFCDANASLVLYLTMGGMHAWLGSMCGGEREFSSPVTFLNTAQFMSR